MEGEVRITTLQKNNLFFSIFSNGLNNEPYGVSYYEGCYEIFSFFFERGNEKILTNMNVIKMKHTITFYLFCI